MARALPRLEWAHPDTRPSLEGDRPFTLAAYEAFVGADPEWVVGGTLRGHDPALEAIKAPTLVVCGRWDGLTLPSIAAECAQRIARSRWHVFEESAHRPWAEQPTEYFEVLEEFLRDHHLALARRPARGPLGDGVLVGAGVVRPEVAQPQRR